MDTDKNEFSPEDSLMVIRSMIESTKYSLSDRSHYFLLWGYATLLATVLNFILAYLLNYPRAHYAWWIIILAIIPHFILLRRDNKRDRVKTFISEAIYYVWTIVGLSFWVLIITFFRIGWEYSYIFFILLYGIGTFISGGLMKFKPLKRGGLACSALF